MKLKLYNTDFNTENNLLGRIFFSHFFLKYLFETLGGLRGLIIRINQEENNKVKRVKIYFLLKDQYICQNLMSKYLGI